MKDVLIVGFGISGLCITRRLEEYSKTFDIISDESQQSSKVAGGILNPVALKRYNLAWNSAKFMPEAIDFYTQFNTDYSESFFEAIPVYKLFTSIEDQNNWTVASDQSALESFINPTIQEVSASVSSIFKQGQVLQSHLLHLKRLLAIEKNKLNRRGHFKSESFSYADLKVNEDHVSYCGNCYSKVIFCEGYGVHSNPFFNWLPLYGNKGEYLIFESKGLKSNSNILKSSYFIIPLGNDMYKYGATYSRDELNDIPTSEGKKDLVEKLSKLIQCDFKILDQIAGVRPTVRDRIPVLGKHPKYKHLHILNGFGSRGVMCAPTLSRELMEHIYKGKSIGKETDVNRFLKFYS
jgi:glycine/D-amino acid oxidase-like deaminating enzyme